MAKVLIAGGGLAGLAAAAALGRDGWEVDLFEARAFLGGRATSYAVPAGGEEVAETIDNCQHVLLRCCVNLLDFYSRLGVRDRITVLPRVLLHRAGRPHLRAAARPPARAVPFHRVVPARCTASAPADKIAIARALLALRRERTRRKDLDRISMLDWLLQKRQTPHAIDRFWRQVLVSAVNEDLDRMAAVHGFQVFWLGFLDADGLRDGHSQRSRSGELYTADAWQRMRQRAHALPRPVERIETERLPRGRRATHGRPLHLRAAFRAAGGGRTAGARIFEHSPITGVHLWFDREVTTLPHATLLDRTMQWMFNKDSGRYLQLVVSASRDLTELSRNEIIDIAIGDLRLYLPAGATRPTLVKAHVVKEQRATFSAAPETEIPASRHGMRQSPTCIWRATGRAPAGPPPWKARCAAAISRRKPLPKC